jgi:hypothetical protein
MDLEICSIVYILWELILPMEVKINKTFSVTMPWVPQGSLSKPMKMVYGACSISA